MFIKDAKYLLIAAYLLLTLYIIIHILYKKQKTLVMNYIKLKIYSIVCYLIGIAMIMLIVLSFIALLTENVPEFVGDIIQWILDQCPGNDSLILLLYFIVFMVLIMVVPYLIAFFSFKKANKLAKKLRRERTLTAKLF